MKRSMRTERGQVESAIGDLKDALKSDDKDSIEVKTKALAEASAGLAQKAYEQAQAAESGGPEAQAQDAADDGVVDAEFEEVSDEDESVTSLTEKRLSNKPMPRPCNRARFWRVCI